MIEYQCRACRKFSGLAFHPQQEGKVRVTCICCRTVQMVFLGNPGGRPLPKDLRAASKAW